MKPLTGNVFALCVLLLATISAVAEEHGHLHSVRQPLVPNEVTAVRIAEAILIPIYGEKQILSERPFHETLRRKVWLVEGTFHGDGFGGVASVQIGQKDARVLEVGHGK